MIKVINTSADRSAMKADVARLDKSNIYRFEEEIRYYIKENCKIIMNLNSVFFIDAEGFMVLLSLKKQIENVGGRLWLVQLTGGLSELFSLMELFDRFDWVSSEYLSDPAFAD